MGMHPTLLILGLWEVRSYGAVLVLATAVGAVVLLRDGSRVGFRRGSLFIFILGAALFGLLGGRLNAWLFYMGGHFSAPNLNLFSMRGGLTSFGSVGAAAAFATVYAWSRGWRVWSFLDLLAPIIPLVEGIVRIGCLLNGCCYGRETSCALALTLPDVQGYWAGRYPTQVLLIVLNLALAGWLWRRRRDRSFDGGLILSYLVVYHIGRFVIDGMRGDQPVAVGILTVHQLVAMMVVVTAAVTMWLKAENARASGLNCVENPPE